ncbi:type II secretion system F family protein [Frondihabitans cladoniiphilus]|uniref:Type II secretion system protein GspF domain-containing protein n=1 Tax=Frondihabitans cladoniiphilus TaxID=715785 RepID=A0ABP8W086_9MICO
MKPRLARRRSAPAASSSSPAAVLDRLAVLLEAGVAPVAAWRHLAQVTEPPRLAERLTAVAAALERGSPGAEALADGDAEWRQIAAAWHVAEVSGAPLGPCLRAIAEACRSTDQARRDADVALSGPIATARVVLALPLVGLLLGVVLGLDTVPVLVGTPVGWACLGGAAALIVAARRWNSDLVARARPADAVPGLELELLAVALGGGGAWSPARRLVREALDRWCASTADPGVEPEVDTLEALSERAGCPAAELLRNAADERRRDARARCAMKAERLGVMLMLPLGACILPAFVLLGVVPLIVALLSSTAGVL